MSGDAEGGGETKTSIVSISTSSGASRIGGKWRMNVD
jgi:hypothetical protein